MPTDFERLNIILAARDREFARAMDRNIRRIERFEKRGKASLSRKSKQFEVLAMAAKRLIIPLTALGSIRGVDQAISSLDDIGKTADKIGLTTDALQELRTIAESAGIAQASFDSSMERFNKRLGEASMGSGAAAKALKQMGLNADDLVSMDLDRALSVIADRIAAIPEPAERAAQAAALFGREGVAMVNLLREGAAGMAEMRQEARDLGIVIDEDVIRGAEEARTQLDLMSRVVRAELNSALVELAPLLVGAATSLANFIRIMGAAGDAVRDFLNPQTDLQIATDNVVLAMADEIRQSQQLDAALQRGGKMSAALARQKLAQAQAHHEAARAAIAEARAVALTSSEFANLSGRIEDAQAAVNAAGFPSKDVAVPRRADAFEEAQRLLADLIVRRQRLLETDQQMTEQYERSERQIQDLTAALANAKNGVVDLGDGLVEPVELTDRLGAGAKRLGDALRETEPELDATAKLLGDMEAAANRAEDATSDALSSILDGSKSAKEAVRELLSEMGRLSISSGSEFLTSKLFDFVGSALGSWGPVKLFNKGGYTGSGNPLQPAGIAHKGEYYFDAPTVRRIGVPMLDAISSGSVPPSAVNAAGHSSVSAGRIVIEARTDPSVILDISSSVAGATVERSTPEIVKKSVVATDAAMRDSAMFGGGR